jgi:UDP-N-acetylmuramoylalanine--D-glutamate ligase
MPQQAAILGFGVTGESVLRHLLARGIEAVVLDTRAPRQTNFSQTEFLWESQHWPGIDVDFAVVSPGLAMDHCLVAGAAASGVQLVSDIDLFFEAVRAPVIGVTGTNGKSTVTALAGHMLNHAGVSCGVGGNLGTAALDLLDDRHQCYVLELSSFQLERSKEQGFDAAVVLNVTEDHLDKHGDMQHYAQAKQRIYTRAARCVFNRFDPLTVPARLDDACSFGLDAPPGAADWGVVQGVDEARVLVRGAESLCAAADLPLSGAHNELNALAACALVERHLDFAQMRAGLVSFKGLPHRFEVVDEFDGVVYVNDSKATNLCATMAALAGMRCADQVILIAGGDAKGVDLAPLAEVFKDRVRHVLTIGRDGPQVAAVAAGCGVAYRSCESLEEAVSVSRELARPGDTVLLSPACASLDMFDNYMQRGERFAQAVAQLSRGNSPAVRGEGAD